jgi:transposase
MRYNVARNGPGPPHETVAKQESVPPRRPNGGGVRTRGLTLDVPERRRLENMSASPAVRPQVAVRSKIVLLAADGLANTEIAALTGVSRPTVTKWQMRYVCNGIDGLVDRDRPGRPRVIDRDRIISETFRPPPTEAGIRPWTSRALAAHLGIGDATVARAWREYGLSIHDHGLFGFATEPNLTLSVVDVVGLYLARAVRGIVLRLDRQPSAESFGEPQPCDCGLGGFAAQLAREHPDSDLRLVVNGTAAPDLLAALPGIRTHVAAQTSLWFNLVDAWCGLAALRTCDDSGLSGQVRAVAEDKRRVEYGVAWTRRTALQHSTSRATA